MKITHKKGEDLVLPNGTIIKANAEGLPKVMTVSDQEIEQEIDDALADPFTDGAAFQRNLADVRADVKQFNPVMLILAYNMWGLDPNAIARFLSLEIEQVHTVMNSELFTETRKELLEAIRYAENSSIHGYLSQKARKAAQVTAAALQSPSADIKLAAAKDILDRAGFRPADRTEHVHRFEDELRITYVEEKTPPTIDVGV